MERTPCVWRALKRIKSKANSAPEAFHVCPFILSNGNLASRTFTPEIERSPPPRPFTSLLCPSRLQNLQHLAFLYVCGMNSQAMEATALCTVRAAPCLTFFPCGDCRCYLHPKCLDRALHMWRKQSNISHRSVCSQMQPFFCHFGMK